MLMILNTWERSRKYVGEGRDSNRWELVPEGERYSDRSSTGAMEILRGSSKTFLPTRAAFPKRVLLRCTAARMAGDGYGSIVFI